MDGGSLSIGGQNIRIFAMSALERLERHALLAHAKALKQLLGLQRIENTIPDSRDEIIRWIVRHQEKLQGGSSLGSVSGSVSPIVGSSLSPLRSDMVGLANVEMAADGLSRPAQTSKFILAQEHSKHAMQLAQKNPMMAAAILREINDGIQRFHDGVYQGDLWLCQRKLTEDIYKELHRDKDGSFLPYKEKFLNFSVVVGHIGYSGNIPCFRYKVAYPEKWTHIFESCWVSVFFTLKEVELNMLLGDRHPYADSGYGTTSPYATASGVAAAELGAELGAERAAAMEMGSAAYRAEERVVRAEERALGMAPADSIYRAEERAAFGELGGRTRKYILEERPSRHAEMFARDFPVAAAAIVREIDDGIQKFHDGVYGGDLFMAEKQLAEDIDKELHRDKDGSFLPFRDKFLNFSVLVGNMAFDGDIPCFQYKVMYPKKWSHRFPGDIYETAYVSIFFTLKEQELTRLLRGQSA